MKASLKSSLRCLLSLLCFTYVHFVLCLKLITRGTQATDGTTAVAAGVLRGCGMQKIGAGINLFAFYVIGVPGGIILAFPLGIGIAGLWFGNFLISVLI